MGAANVSLSRLTAAAARVQKKKKELKHTCELTNQLHQASKTTQSDFEEGGDVHVTQQNRNRQHPLR